jgi:hypothetical protein
MAWRTTEQVEEVWLLATLALHTSSVRRHVFLHAIEAVENHDPASALRLRDGDTILGR